VNAAAEIARGRELYATQAWSGAYQALSSADAADGLGPEDLELLSISAYMLGRDQESMAVRERAHHGHVEAGQTLRAARCAFWVGMQLALAGEMSGASGWLGRAHRLVEREGGECVEQGYLLLPRLFQHEEAGEFEAGAAVGGEAAELGQRFGDPDLFGLGVHMQGHLLVKQGRVVEGLALLDESMVAVTTGELSPIVSGIVYCGVILACQDALDVGRAREWTAALTRWCEKQPDLVAYSGRCLVHRAEIMQLEGDWSRALAEAELGKERAARSNNRMAAGDAAYLRAEVHRLQGDFPAAEEAYREASRCGREPQPGLALLRLAQGNGEAASAAIRRVAAEAEEHFARARVLPAYVEIMLAVGEVEEAGTACGELERICESMHSELLAAQLGHATGAVALAEGDATAALAALRRAARAWQRLAAPYEEARTRWLLGLACRALGDDDAARLELDAAREAFGDLGAGPDLARIEPQHRHGLTPREAQVLRLVAAGRTNKAIAAELVLSERTVDRHVSNIFSKLRVSSRSAATAYAYEHELV
jgi:DNA-binding CsgD family transcriptional regulator